VFVATFAYSAAGLYTVGVSGGNPRNTLAVIEDGLLAGGQ